MMRFIHLLILLVFYNYVAAQDVDPGIGDTIHAVHYSIYLDEVNTSQRSIKGHTEIVIIPLKNSLNYIPLELKDLDVDSVLIVNSQQSFTHVDGIVRIDLLSPLSPGDTLMLDIYYHGKPFQEDWGGFHFDGKYAFNLGVGFVSIPHNLGKTWFPCVDNFTDRATYDFYVTVDKELKAICGGVLQDTTEHPDGTQTWHWKLKKEIPTYLASVAIGEYMLYHDQYIGIEDTIPITIYSRPSEYSKIEGSFVNLKPVLKWFEERFGPYPFGRVGYVGTEKGAMEHATNIAYPNSTINGNTGSESLYVHELAHMWFGDKVTCSSAEDMWMNEGWATFCETLYVKELYSYENYRSLFRKDHREVLRKTHINDGGYFPLNDIPQEETYGSHAYDKGGIVANALRGYLGDSVFFNAMTAYLDHFAYQSVSSEDMRDFLINYTGIEMSGFFDAWVFTEGSPQYGIDSTRISKNNGGYQVDIWMKQKFKAAEYLGDNVVTEVNFMDHKFQIVSDTVHFSGEQGHSVKYLDFMPVAVFLDLYEKACDATTDNFRFFTNPLEYVFPETYFKILIDKLDDSAMLQVTHNWVPPDSLKLYVDGLRLSDYRYWTIDGIVPDSFQARGRFTYDRDGYLDGGLIQSESDSVVVLYRRHSSGDWTEVEQSRFGLWDFGYIDVYDLQAGQYTLAVWDKHIVGTSDVPQQSFVKIYPNPSQGSLNFEFYERGKYNIILYDSKGMEVDKFTLNGKTRSWKWRNQRALQGVYFVHVFKGDKRLTVKKMVFTK